MVRTPPTVPTWLASKHPRNACVQVVVDGDDDSKHVAVLLIGDTGTAEPPFDVLTYRSHRIELYPNVFRALGARPRANASRGARRITNDFELARFTRPVAGLTTALGMPTGSSSSRMAMSPS
jgi:hypothetical protein